MQLPAPLLPVQGGRAMPHAITQDRASAEGSLTCFTSNLMGCYITKLQ